MTPPAPLRAAAPASATATPVRPKGAQARRFRFELAAHATAPARARRMTCAGLRAWEAGQETCDAAALVVSELVTNALVHTASARIVCELIEGPRAVRVEVCDEGRVPLEPPCPAAVCDEEEHGRGLLLVAALCSAWGSRGLDPGLQVWAELPYAADARDTGKEADAVRGTGAEWVC